MNKETTIQLSEHEIETLKQFGNANQKLVFTAGNLLLSKLSYLRAEKELAVEQEKHNELFKTFLSNLETKYGAGSLDLAKGTFTPAPVQ